MKKFLLLDFSHFLNLHCWDLVCFTHSLSESISESQRVLASHLTQLNFTLKRSQPFCGYWRLIIFYFQKLDFENPNERKFLLVVVATEEKTKERLSSSATITVEVEDLNDNNPLFDLDSYTATIPENSVPGDYSHYFYGWRVEL